MADEDLTCEATTHRFGYTLVSEGKPAKCHCGGVIVNLVNSRIVYSMTVEAMQAGGMVEHAEAPGMIGSGYSLSWGGKPRG